MKIKALLLIILLVVLLITGCRSQFISSGIIYLQQNNVDKALEQFQLAVKNEPNNPEAYMWLARAYILDDEYEKAANNIVKSLEVDTTDGILKEMRKEVDVYWSAMYNAGNGYIRNKDAKERAADYEKWLKTANIIKDTLPNYSSLMILYATIGDEKNMTDIFEKAKQKDPNNLSIYFNIARFYIEKNDFDKALNYLKNAEKIDSKNIKVEYWLGKLYSAKNENDNAIKALKKVESSIEALPEEERESMNGLYIDAVNEIALIYRAKKDYKNSLIYFDKLYNLDKEDLTAYYNLGIAYYYTKNYSKTIDILEDFIKKSETENSTIYLILSDCYNNLGNTDKALKNYNKYKELEKQGK